MGAAASSPCAWLWLRRSPLEPHSLAFDKPLCASLDELRLHGATGEGAPDSAEREALPRYVLRPPIARGTRGAACRRLAEHHTEEGLQRRDGRGRHGQGCRCRAVWPPAYLRRACIPSAMRACSRPPARGGLASRQRRPRRIRLRRRRSRAGRGRPADIVRGRNSLRSPHSNCPRSSTSRLPRGCSPTSPISARVCGLRGSLPPAGCA